MNRILRIGIPWAAALMLSGQALAWNIFPYGVDQASKWGDNTIGTPGGAVTWSLIADGTGLATGSPGYVHGSSQLGLLFGAIDAAYGASTALAALQDAFASWSAVADIQFVQVTESGCEHRGQVPRSASWDVGPAPLRLGVPRSRTLMFD